MDEKDKKIIMKAWEKAYGTLYNVNDIAEHEWEYGQRVINETRSADKKRDG